MEDAREGQSKNNGRGEVSPLASTAALRRFRLPPLPLHLAVRFLPRSMRFRKNRRILGIGLLAAVLLFLAVFVFLPRAGGKGADENAPLAARVFHEALLFLEDARLGPFEALRQYAAPNTSDYFQEISEKLWHTVLPELGWRWFFHGALMTMAETPAEAAPQTEADAPARETQRESPAAEPDEILVSFYHPWSDTAFITVWANAARDEAGKNADAGETLETRRRVYIRDCEFLMGDVFRSRGDTPARPATTRAWARRRQYFAAAIAQVSANSLRALELLTYSSNTRAANAREESEGTPPRAESARNAASWRANIPAMLDDEALLANHFGAGLLMLAAVNDVARYSAPTNVLAIRVLPALQRLHSATNAIKMEWEARRNIGNIPENFRDYYLPAFYANSSERAFLMLQAKHDPKKCLAFLFGLEMPEKDEEDALAQEAPSDAGSAALVYDETLPPDDEEPDKMYPEAHYPIKLLRVDPIDFHAVYTNLYPRGGAQK